VLLLQGCGSLDQLKNQCRDAGDCHHRPHNYDGTCAPASARQSLRIRSYCLFTICKPSNDLSFHLVHRCNQMHAFTRAWQNIGGAKLPTIKPSQPSYRDGNNFRWCDAFDSVAEFPPRSATFGAPHPLCSGQRPNCGSELKSE